MQSSIIIVDIYTKLYDKKLLPTVCSRLFTHCNRVLNRFTEFQTFKFPFMSTYKLPTKDFFISLITGFAELC